MEEINNIAIEIRKYVNEFHLYDKHFLDRNDDWKSICVGMDLLEDSCLALIYYEENAVGGSDGEKYLKLYGFLQAVFLQQDSIKFIYENLLGHSLKPDPNSAWEEIRNLRNLTTGHPIKQGWDNKIKRCFVHRITLKKDSFSVTVFDNQKSAPENKDINLKNLFDRYKSEAITCLKKILETRRNA
ncbi:MAG: hypothetical protein PHE84_00605 [bacterium]|nr:hypothetical protein [bacterium]